MQEKVQSLEKSIKSLVCAIVVPRESDDPSKTLTRLTRKLKILEVKLKKNQDNLT